VLRRQTPSCWRCTFHRTLLHLEQRHIQSGARLPALILPALTAPTASNESMIVMSFSVPSSNFTQPESNRTGVEEAAREVEARSGHERSGDGACHTSRGGTERCRRGARPEPRFRPMSAITSRDTSEKCVASWPGREFRQEAEDRAELRAGNHHQRERLPLRLERVGGEKGCRA